MRHRISERERHSEAGNAPAMAIEEMKAVKTTCSLYDEEDIYNINETGIFLATIFQYWVQDTHRSWHQKRKELYTTCLLQYCFLLCVIGHAVCPRALQRVNTEATGMIWKSNKKACMTIDIMREWLNAFYQHVETGRRVLHLMDQFFAHLAAVNITIAPPNIRPLDKGIIQNYKQNYRKQWLDYQLKCFNQDVNSFIKMSVYKAIIWSVLAWKFEVLNNKIYVIASAQAVGAIYATKH
ncbi:unnamed protein product [Blumeria hordei]|uniref:DDE-1 domain-containing protein n=1 Tax=Blumeria hordei TaxID=2867405 RepID=A0A383UI58_BLUHO|nr:unnamed protein product [Blumeria hordei]